MNSKRTNMIYLRRLNTTINSNQDNKKAGYDVVDKKRWQAAERVNTRCELLGIAKLTV